MRTFEAFIPGAEWPKFINAPDEHMGANVPVVTTLAIEEPEISPVIPDDSTAALAGPPLYLPNIARARLVKNRPAAGSDAYARYEYTHNLLRVMESVRAGHGEDAVFPYYWEVGRRIHHDQDRAFPAAAALASSAPSGAAPHTIQRKVERSKRSTAGCLASPSTIGGTR